MSHENKMCNFNNCHRCQTSLKKTDGFVFQDIDDINVFCTFCAKLHSIKKCNFMFGTFVLETSRKVLNKNCENLSDLGQE